LRINWWLDTKFKYVHNKKACSAFKKLDGNAWNSVMKSFNFPDVTCPLPVVMYKNNHGHKLHLKIVELINK